MGDYITWRDIKSYSKFVELSEAVRRDPNIVNNKDKQRAILKALDQWEENYRREHPTGNASRQQIRDHGKELFPQGKGGVSSNVNAKSAPDEPGVTDADIESVFLNDK